MNKIVDDFADISARLRELERRQKVLEDFEHLRPKDAPFQNYAICPECEGRGGQVAPHPDSRQLPILITCRSCYGSGTVPTRRQP